MYLDSLDNMDITMHIDSPGGSVKSGLSMVDVMGHINSDIITVNTGMKTALWVPFYLVQVLKVKDHP